MRYFHVIVHVVWQLLMLANSGYIKHVRHPFWYTPFYTHYIEICVDGSMFKSYKAKLTVGTCTYLISSWSKHEDRLPSLLTNFCKHKSVSLHHSLHGNKLEIVASLLPLVLYTSGVMSKFPRRSPSRISVPALYTTTSGSNSSSTAGKCLWS